MRALRAVFATGLAIMAALALADAIRIDASSERRIIIHDDCDPATFNAAVGPGTCVGEGTTTFQDFIAALAQNKTVAAWNFLPDRLTLEPGDELRLRSRGGEPHTFTKVAAFGGGFIADLNFLAGTPTPRPECAVVLADGSLAPREPSASNVFVPAGGRDAVDPGVLALGENRFQCCIHPWMRAVVEVREE